MEPTQQVFINFTIPEIITPNEVFSCKNELKNEWPDIADKVFPNVNLDKDKFSELPLDSMSCSGSNFNFRLDENDLEQDDIDVLAYMLARAVQQQHDLPSTQIDIEITQGNETKVVTF